MAMHMGHLALRVTDADAYAAFAKNALGLREVERTATAILLSASEKHHELELIPGDEDGVDHVGLEVESPEAVQAVQAAVEAAGITCHAVPESEAVGLGDAIRFTGPGGIGHEIYTGMPREAVSIGRYAQRPVRRLGHLTFMSAEHLELEAFWMEVLGFRVSDRLGPVAWLRCDQDHHVLAVGPRPEGTALNHHAWQTQDLGTLGSYCDELINQDVALMWGPVRHGPGFNLAAYAPDPAGALVEVYADLLQIIDEAGYIAKEWAGVPNALNLWGPPMPPEFVRTGIPSVGFAARTPTTVN